MERFSPSGTSYFWRPWATWVNMLLIPATGDAPGQAAYDPAACRLTGSLYVRRACCWVGGVHLVVYEVTSAIKGVVPCGDTLATVQ
ncbi:hypothetical protein ACE3MQ_18825 [Paenibacillus lentus]|uniref:hypothetical protein n=1 Tax=Paenibacillus lentus TaxID=1338368 RepID=UPI00365F2D15